MQLRIGVCPNCGTSPDGAHLSEAIENVNHINLAPSDGEWGNSIQIMRYKYLPRYINHFMAIVCACVFFAGAFAKAVADARAQSWANLIEISFGRHLEPPVLRDQHGVVVSSIRFLCLHI